MAPATTADGHFSRYGEEFPRCSESMLVPAGKCVRAHGVKGRLAQVCPCAKCSPEHSGRLAGHRAGELSDRAAQVTDAAFSTVSLH